jgi:uncharacterized Rmd1/YagE family protein
MMNTAPAFERWTHVRVRALLIGLRIDLRALDRPDNLSAMPLAIHAGEQGVAVLFRYGAIVLFNVAVLEEAAFLRVLGPFIGEPLSTPEDETAQVEIGEEGDERVDVQGTIRLREATLDRLLLVADVLAKSVSLGYNENRLARAFDRIEPVAQALRLPGDKTIPARQLLDHIGDVLITQHRMVGRVEVSEKPDLLWDKPNLERLYLRLGEEYELTERDRALSRKLDLIAQTATTSLGLLQARRSLRVEWYIVVLIIVEIILTLYDMFIAG